MVLALLIAGCLLSSAMAGFLARWNTTLATPLEPEPLATGRRYLAPLGWSPGAH